MKTIGLQHFPRRLLPGLALLCLMLLGAAGASADVLINEVMASNGTYKDGHAYDWIELVNTSSKQADISGWFLSDSKKNPEKWAFPDKTVIKGNGTLLVYCTGEDGLPKVKGGVYYADFKISASGEKLYLTQKDGTPADKAELPAQYGTVSWGRTADGTAYGYFAEATPNAKNGKTVYAGRAEKPALLTSSGFYDAPVTVTAQADEGEIRYTRDGSTPTEKSPLFPAEGLICDKTTVLRVRAFAAGLVPSETVSASYFIGLEQPVPVISLVTDEKYLFAKKTGLLVKGSNADYPNYEHDWEYPVNAEYFDETGAAVLNQLCTFTTAGHSARQNAQKSIALFARKAYGEETFSFNPFPHRDYTEYKSLLLRSANSDAFSTRLRDPVISSLANGLDIIYQDALAIEVYINGEYWGHYNLREKINKYFVAQWENIDLSDEDTVDGIDLLARTGSDDYVQSGSNEDWLALCDFCRTKDLNVPENLDYVLERLDAESLFTHAAFEIIIGNTDYTNVRMYRVPGGKWKYLLFDVEAGFLSQDKDPMGVYIKPVSSKIQYFRHEPLNALLAVPEMKAQFLRRFAEVLEHSFQWPDVEAAFAPWEELLENTLLPRHLTRWKHFTLKEWRQNVDAVKYYARVRPLKILNQLQTHMKLTDAEMEEFFGSVRVLLEEKNGK